MKKRVILITSLLITLFSLTIVSFSFAKEEKSNPDIVRIDFVHYKNVQKPGKTTVEPGYKLLGYKWPSLPVNYVINPANSGLDETTVTREIYTAAETWDKATSKELFNDNYSVDYNAQYGYMDGQNSIAFGPAGDNYTIAVTSIWFNKRTRTILETDMLFNSYFKWGVSTGPSDITVMDVQNIAAHELGHVAGLDDLYAENNVEKTMFGYSTYGEIKKRTLELSDISGIQKLYGK